VLNSMKSSLKTVEHVISLLELSISTNVVDSRQDLEIFLP
jgi:hypothetical protein